MSESSEDSDFEEVGDNGDGSRNEADYLIARHAQDEEDKANLQKYQEQMDIPKEGLKITIQEGTVNEGRKKKGFDLQDYFRKLMNRHRKSLQEDLHKASVLCLLARGMYINKILISEEILALGLSTLPSKQSYPPKNIDLTYLESFIKWFKIAFKMKNSADDKSKKKTPTKGQKSSPSSTKNSKGSSKKMSKNKKQDEDDKKDDLVVDVEADNVPLKELIMSQLENRTVINSDHLVFMFIVILRSLGVQVRLIMSLQPIPLKPPSADLVQPPKKERASKKRKSDDVSEKKSSSTASKKNKPVDSKVQPSTSKSSQSGKSNVTTRGRNSAKKPKLEKNSESHSEADEKEDEEDEYKPIIDSDSDSDFITSRSSSSQKRKKPAATAEKRRQSLNSSTKTSSSLSSSPSPKKLVSGKGRKMISSDSSEEEEDSKKTVQESKDLKNNKQSTRVYYDVWAEVYLEEEERWVSVDLMSAKIMCDKDFEPKATPPLVYVLAYANDKRIKDITRRYASKWMTVTQKLRVDKSWWAQSLRPFRGRQTRQDKEEDELLDQLLLNEAIPKSVSELKGHPLFVLRRHLLKFEAIYPENPPALGFVKSEAIYARDCVKTLHSRELWMRQAKVVRLGEKPYKIVKARPKYDKGSATVIRDRPLELFGEWQVEDYIPPIAQNGKVPRNDYGNVELFMDKMLPGGTAWIKEPGLNKVAKKLNIDCAPALVGFDFHGGFSHPTYEGFVVCEEFKDILLDACRQEQEEAQKREEAKRRKRVTDNWKRLIRGVIIRRRLERKYDAFDFGTKGTKTKRPISTPAPSSSVDAQPPPKKKQQTKRRRNK